MKRVIIFLAVILAAGTSGLATAQKKSHPVVYYKSNMHCVDCERALFEHLRFEKGVVDLKLDHVSNTIKVVYAEKRTNGENIRDAVVRKGYSAESISEKEYQKFLESAAENKPSGQSPSKH